MQTGKERDDVTRYPSPDELWNLTFAAQSDWRDRFAGAPYPDKSGTWTLRFYQEIAVNRVIERISGNAQRILLTLATGTGKTSIAFQITWKLFKTRWNLSREPERQPRILFLADRNNLADQAYNDFTSFAAFAEDALMRIAPDSIRKKAACPLTAAFFSLSSRLS